MAVAAATVEKLKLSQMSWFPPLLSPNVYG